MQQSNAYQEAHRLIGLGLDCGVDSILHLLGEVVLVNVLLNAHGCRNWIWVVATIAGEIC